jgi:hypothetical protein
MYEPKVIAVTAGIVIALLIVVALGAIVLGIIIKAATEWFSNRF